MTGGGAGGWRERPRPYRATPPSPGMQRHIVYPSESLPGWIDWRDGDCGDTNPGPDRVGSLQRFGWRMSWLVALTGRQGNIEVCTVVDGRSDFGCD